MAWVASNKVINSNAKAPAVATATKPQQRARSTLSMYTESPSGEIALEEFERFALDRLKGATVPCGRTDAGQPRPCVAPTTPSFVLVPPSPFPRLLAHPPPSPFLTQCCAA